MITNFEEITCDLTKEEKKIIPIVIAKLKKHSVKNPIKSFEIVKFIYKETGYKLGQPRFRKICNFIRCNSIIPLIATSRGYYVSKSKAELEKQINSLFERSDAIVAAASGLYHFIKTK